MTLDAALLSELIELRRQEYGDGGLVVEEFGDQGSHCAGDCSGERATMAAL